MPNTSVNSSFRSKLNFKIPVLSELFNVRFPWFLKRHQLPWGNNFVMLLDDKSLTILTETENILKLLPNLSLGVVTALRVHLSFVLEPNYPADELVLRGHLP